MNLGLASLPSQAQYESACAPVGPAGVASERMYVRQFASESYPVSRAARRGRTFWRSFDCARRRPRAGLKPSPRLRCAGDPEGMTLGCLTAGSQTLSPSARRSRLPIGLLPLDEDIEVETISGPLWVPPGTLVLLGADQEWRIALNRIVPIVVLSLSDSVLNGRFAGWRPFDAPRRLQPEGFAGVFIKLIETAAAEMEALSTAQWQATRRGLAHVLSRSCDEGRIPQDAPLSDGDAKPQ
jgi:hypothetical protein